MAKQSKAEPAEALWVSVEDACAIWGFPIHLVDDWIAKGLFPSPRKFNARVLRFPKEVVESVHQLVKYGWLPLSEPGQPLDEKS